MQRGPPVPARGGLPVPLLRLLGGGQHSAVAGIGLPVAYGLPLTYGLPVAYGLALVMYGLALVTHDRMILPCRLTVILCGPALLGHRPAVERSGEPVRGLAVPAFGGGPHPPLGAGVAAVLQQVGEGVRAQRVPLLGGLAQPVLGGRLVAALAVVPPERVCGGGGTGDGGDPPPSGGLVGVPALVQKDTQVVGGGTVTRGGGGAQLGLGSVEITAAQQHGPENAHRLDVAGLGGEPLTRLLGGLTGLVPVGELHKIAVCAKTSCCANRPVSNRVALSPITSIVAPPATWVHLVYRSQ